MIQEQQKWYEKFVTLQAFGAVVSVLIAGIGWALLATDRVDARSQRRDDDINKQLEIIIRQQGEQNNAIIRMGTLQDSEVKALEAIAKKLDVTITP